MPSDRYTKHRSRAAEDQAAVSREGRDIGDHPPIANKRRRKGCARNFRKYLETYHAPAFPLPWSDFHRDLIARIEQTVLDGELSAFAMPRGSGKTTISERAVLWATLYRHHLFAFLIAANDTKATDNMQSLQIELVCNELLYADFPEVCYALRALDWIANRAKGQLMAGEPTLVEWGKRVAGFPAIDGVPGPIIKAGGLLTAIRGSKHTKRDGTVVRPTLALLDDPQTTTSAKSALQCQRREELICGDVLGMAPPDESMAALLAATVIERGDCVDRLLSRDLHPDWHGQRTKLLDRFPARIDLWQQYHDVLVEELQNDGDGSLANAFYRKQRKAMDAGAQVTWKERFVDGKELSAVQHAMNLWFRDQNAFFSEYQNEPLADVDADEADAVTAEAIVLRTPGVPRGVIPADATLLTAYTDVQDKLLYYAVVAWSDDFTGTVIEYGTWPDQQRQYFTLGSAKLTLARRWPKLSKEARLRRALELHLDDGEQPGLMAREWTRDDDGAALMLDQSGVDCGYKGDDVKAFVRESRSRARLMPCHGKGVKATNKPFNEWKKKTGDKVGSHWRISKTGRRALRHLLIDTNYWKSFVHARLATAPEERGALRLHKGTPKAHRMLADHLTAEKKQRVSGPERTVDEWIQRPGQDNHLFDCVVGAACLASLAGCKLKVSGAKAAATETGEKRLKLSELRPKKRRR